MNLKELWSKKTTWTGLALAVYGLYNKDIESIFTGLGFIFLREAVIKDVGR